MFNWARKLMGLSPGKDTEAHRLREEIRSNVQKCKAESAKGDSSATLKLGALKASLNEQSLRLLKPNGPKALAFVVIACLVLGVGGCSVADRREILESAVVVVEAKAVGEVTKELVKEGIDPVQAKKVAEIAVRKIDELLHRLIE